MSVDTATVKKVASLARIAVTDDGYTREVAGQANAQVCLASDQPRFFHLFMQRLLAR